MLESSEPSIFSGTASSIGPSRVVSPTLFFGFSAELEDAAYLNLKLGKVEGRVTYNDGNDTLYFENLVADQGRSHFVANGTIDVGKTDDVKMSVQVSRRRTARFKILRQSSGIS